MIKFPKNILLGIEKHLKEEKARVEKQLLTLKEQDPFSDTDRLSDNAASDTEAKEEFNHDRYEAMMGELKIKLQQINKAFEKIQNSTYGTCEKCQQMIDTDRLAAIPTATLCMSCEANNKIHK